MALAVATPTTDFLSRTSGFVDYNSAYTTCFWMYHSTNNAAFQLLWYPISTDDGNYDGIGIHSGATTYWFEVVGPVSSSNQVGTIATGNWYHVAVVRESTTSLKLYSNGTLVSTDTSSVAGRSAAGKEYIFKVPAGGFGFAGRMTAFKQWDAALTIGEVVAEMTRLRPVRTANLRTWLPMYDKTVANNGKDYSQFNRDFTISGSPTFTDAAPPVSWGNSLITVATTPQYAYAVSDVSAGSWSASSGSDLFAMIDETSINDSDYITSTVGSTCEVALGSVFDPVSSSGHIVRYRVIGTGGANLTVSLRQGASTTIASWTHTPAPVSLTTYEQTLSGGEADSITNYSDLRLRFVSS